VLGGAHHPPLVSLVLGRTLVTFNGLARVAFINSIGQSPLPPVGGVTNAFHQLARVRAGRPGAG
jgi:hypothetical protein